MKNRANPDNCRALNRKYLASEKGKVARQKAQQKYRERNKIKQRARDVVAYAIRKGELIPWPVCAIPECCEKHPHAHHPDYTRPLDVIWLCDHHHKQAHALVNGHHLG